MKAHSVIGAGGVKLHVREWGKPDAPPILFIHGWSQNHLCWAKQYESALAEAQVQHARHAVRGGERRVRGDDGGELLERLPVLPLLGVDPREEHLRGRIVGVRLDALLADDHRLHEAAGREVRLGERGLPSQLPLRYEEVGVAVAKGSRLNLEFVSGKCNLKCRMCLGSNSESHTNRLSYLTAADFPTHKLVDSNFAGDPACQSIARGRLTSCSVNSSGVCVS